MKKHLLHILFVTVTLFSCNKKSEKETELTGLDLIISTMTLEEKIGQMTNLTLSTIAFEDSLGDVKIDTSKLIYAVKDKQIGSFQNVINHAYRIEEWHSILNTIQRLTLKHNNQKIPMLYCIDAIHGMNYSIGSTIFPHNIGMAATRNPELVKQSSQVTAKECRATGIRYNFDPVLDVGREQQWSRFGETYGEDTYLTTIMGTTAITAYEGNDLTSVNNVASCMKHFIGYGSPRNGRDRAPALIPEVHLREYYLPVFQKAIETGASTLMVNSGEVNGEPVHASKYLLTDVLREELGYRGVIISDWQDILKMHERHRVADSHKEAVRLAIEAGIDLVIVPFDYRFTDDLIELVNEEIISEERLNASVKRILALKQKVGLFKNPYVEKSALANFGKNEYQEIALKCAEESMTLLKNKENILPFTSGEKITVMGPTANSLAALHGAWTYTWQGQEEKYFEKTTHTIAESMTQRPNVNFVDGIKFQNKDLSISLPTNQTVVYCLGEDAYAETPGNIPNLDLDDSHLEIIQKLKHNNNRIVLVLTQGRPRIIREIEPLVDGILLAYLPGSYGAMAISKTLYGEVNPSGKLPYTYPRYAGERITYDHKTLDEAIEIAKPYSYDYEFNPQYPFGFGLSYTTFSYSDIQISKDTIIFSDTLTVSVTVTNRGNKLGKETIELYLRDEYASITPCVKRLKKFKKVELKSNASETVVFKLTEEDLSFVHRDKTTYAETGTFSVMIADKIKKFYLW